MEELPCGEALTRLAAEVGGRVAIICDDNEVTFAELEGRANRLAREYADRGVEHNSFVAIALPNDVEVYVAALAAWKLGATPMIVSDRLPDAELQPILELADPRLVVGLPLERAGGRVALAAGVTPGATVSEDPHPPLTARYVRALTSGGSTGRPKVIVSRQPGVVPAPMPGVGGGIGEVRLVTSPLFHTLGFSSLLVLLSGATQVVMRRFDPRVALELIERHRCTYLAAVPTMLHRIWRLPTDERLAFDVSSLRTVFSTAGPFPAWLKQAWMDWLGPEKIVEIYGSSESYGSTIVTGEEAWRKPGTVGKPRFGPPRILREDGSECAVGEVGIIHFERPAEPAYFYIGAESRVRDGWETLGDMGWVDDDGYLFLADRRVDMIVTGGENVFPAEVESAIDECEGVRSSVVIGLPDDDLGQRVHAIVDVGRDGGGVSDCTESDLRMFLAARLVRYKIPRTFEFCAEPLRSDANKVRRSQLRDERIASATD